MYGDKLAEAVAVHLDFTTGGNYNWSTQEHRAYYNGDAARSGLNIYRNQESWMQATVQDEGTLKFDWKVDCIAHVGKKVVAANAP